MTGESIQRSRFLTFKPDTVFYPAPCTFPPSSLLFPTPALRRSPRGLSRQAPGDALRSSLPKTPGDLRGAHAVPPLPPLLPSRGGAGTARLFPPLCAGLRGADPPPLSPCRGAPTWAAAGGERRAGPWRGAGGAAGAERCGASAGAGGVRGALLAGCRRRRPATRAAPPCAAAHSPPRNGAPRGPPPPPARAPLPGHPPEPGEAAEEGGKAAGTERWLRPWGASCPPRNFLSSPAESGCRSSPAARPTAPPRNLGISVSGNSGGDNKRTGTRCLWREFAPKRGRAHGLRRGASLLRPSGAPGGPAVAVSPLPALPGDSHGRTDLRQPSPRALRTQIGVFGSGARLKRGVRLTQNELHKLRRASSKKCLSRLQHPNSTTLSVCSL